MSINNATPKEWDNLFRGPDKREECLMTDQVKKAEDIKESLYKNTITGSQYHPSDSSLDKQIDWRNNG